MAKKIVDVKYLHLKLKELNDQRNKVESILEQYSELYTRLTGAIETTEDMLNDLQDESKQVLDNNDSTDSNTTSDRSNSNTVTKK
jgi:hypothetical protein